MASKKTYVYRMLIGNDGKADVDMFMYARNKDTAVEYCKELYRDKKYNDYRAIKVGVSLWLRETGKITAEDEEKLRKSVASASDKYSEQFEVPQFIPKEETGVLS